MTLIRESEILYNFINSASTPQVLIVTMAATVNMGQSASIVSFLHAGAGFPITWSEYDDNTSDRLIEDGKTIEQLLDDTTTESVYHGNARGHEIRKRSPLPPWAPLIYASCALGTKIGLPVGGVTSTILTAGLGKAVLPVVLPAVGKAFLAGVCPKLSLVG